MDKLSTLFSLMPENPTSSLESFLKTLDAQTVSNTFLYVIAAFFLCSLVIGLLKVWQKLIHHTPSILVSIGILGTFTGIVIGLLEFDPKQIDGSIEVLLEGLKTAFITSLAGMVAAIVYRILGATPIFGLLGLSDLIRRKVSSKRENVQPSDILQAIQKQTGFLESTSKQAALTQKTIQSQLTATEELKKSISNDSDSSLLGVIKLLKADMNDNAKHRRNDMEAFEAKLTVKLDEVAESLSKAASEHIIEALKETIKDFNNKLTEQFGDNFKRLDDSVSKLVTWQENYKDELGIMQSNLDAMVKQYQAGVQALTVTQSSIATIESSAKTIPDSMQTLKPILTGVQHQIDELSRHLEAFQMMRDKATDALPEIRKQVEETINEVAGTVNIAKDKHNALLKDTEHLHSLFSTQIDQITQQMKSSIESTLKAQTSEIDKATKHMSSSIEGSVNKQTTEIDNVVKKLESSMNQSMKETQQTINKEIDALNEAMPKVLQKVIGEMGSSLTSITHKFTDDYQKLVNEMKAITNAHR